MKKYTQKNSKYLSSDRKIKVKNTDIEESFDFINIETSPIFITGAGTNDVNGEYLWTNISEEEGVLMSWKKDDIDYNITLSFGKNTWSIIKTTKDIIPVSSKLYFNETGNVNELPKYNWSNDGAGYTGILPVPIISE
jgi:hypothetical protein